MFALALIFMGIEAINCEKVHASSESERKTYYAGDTAYIDLDGDGKKESVSIKEYKAKNYYGYEVFDSWEIFINGKSMGKKYVYYDGEDLEGLCFQFLDIYKKDKYKEIGIRFYSYDPMDSGPYEAYRYVSGKCTLVFADDFVGTIWDEQKKKNHLIVDECSLCDLGCVFYKVDYVIEDKELVKAGNKACICEYDTWKDEFTANQSINIYKKNSLKKKNGKIAKGEKFKVYKLKLSKSGKIVAAYIKSSKGVKGWIDVNTGYSQDEENGLVKDSFYWG